MFACGTKIPKISNNEALLNEIRKVDNLDIHLKLNELDMTLKPTANLKGKPINEYQGKNQELEELKAEIKNKDNEIEALEKKYLARIARLFIMAQVHCEVKNNINETISSIKPSTIVIEDFNKE